MSCERVQNRSNSEEKAGSVGFEPNKVQVLSHVICARASMVRPGVTRDKILGVLAPEEPLSSARSIQMKPTSPSKGTLT